MSQRTHRKFEEGRRRMSTRLNLLNSLAQVAWSVLAIFIISGVMGVTTSLVVTWIVSR